MRNKEAVDGTRPTSCPSVDSFGKLQPMKICYSHIQIDWMSAMFQISNGANQEQGKFGEVETCDLSINKCSICVLLLTKK